MDKNILNIDMNLEEEIKANQYNIRCIKYTALLSFLVLLANEFRIFIIDDILMRPAYILLNIFILIPLIVQRIKGYDYKYLKYILLGFYVLALSVINILLTYHIVLFWGVQFLMASHYREKKVSLYVYLCSVVGISLSVLLGYKYGLADLNYMGMITGSVSEWGGIIDVHADKLDFKIATRVFIFFAVPRIMIASIYANMGLAIADSVGAIEKSKREMMYENTHDLMTGFYNKKHYESMKERVYKKLKNVGIIFFDINNLKYVNDNLGHDKGDQLIEMASKSIGYILSNRINAYRVGGDEFVVVVEEPVEGEINNLLIRWQRALDKVNKSSGELQCSMAVGDAIGKGEDIENIYKFADEHMYIDKAEKKSKLENK